MHFIGIKGISSHTGLLSCDLLHSTHFLHRILIIELWVWKQQEQASEFLQHAKLLGNTWWCEWNAFRCFYISGVFLEWDEFGLENEQYKKQTNKKTVHYAFMTYLQSKYGWYLFAYICMPVCKSNNKCTFLHW